MTLIFGLCLPRKIYLVSDSRLSSTDGTYKDDFGKWLDLNPRLSVIVANNAHQASWFLRKIIKDVRKDDRMDWDFTDLEQYLHANMKRLAGEYYSETGEYARSVGFIFGGFEKNKKLEIESSRMGEAMSVPIRQAGEGVLVTQTVDMAILDAFRPVLDEAMRKGEAVEAGALFEVDLPKPRVLAVTVRATNLGAEVNYEDVACFDGIAFNPEYKTERVILPPDLIGNLVYRDQSDEKGEDVIYKDYGYIITYVHRLLSEKKWPTVGGEVLPLLVMPDSSGFATGMHIRTSIEGELFKGGIGEVDGKMHYYDTSGNLIPYRFIYEYLDYHDKSDEAKL